MDIVTAGRACLRRWYLFVPIVVIGVLASIHIANATKPTFEATGQFIVLNSANRPVTAKTPAPRATVTRIKGSAPATPTPTSTPTPEPTSTVENPYSGNQDLLRAALLAQLNGAAFHTKLSNAGLKGSFSVAIAKKQPLFNLTAQARHRDQAITLANTALSDANAQLSAVQLAAGAPRDALLRTQTINEATDAADITSGKSKRLVAGIVVSVAAAVALAIALDSSVLSLRRRRNARHAGVPQTAGSPIESAVYAPANTQVVDGGTRATTSEPGTSPINQLRPGQ